MGHQLESVYPIAFLPKDHALAVAIMSYNGEVNFGLLADYDALPDIDVINEGIAQSLNELLKAARKQRRQRSPKKRKKTSQSSSG
jgi:hypothetical protein